MRSGVRLAKVTLAEGFWASMESLSFFSLYWGASAWDNRGGAAAAQGCECDGASSARIPLSVNNVLGDLPPLLVGAAAVPLVFGSLHHDLRLACPSTPPQSAASRIWRGSR